MTVASKFIRMRVKDSAGAIVVDTPIDPGATLPPLTWQTRSFTLNTPHARTIASIEIYIDMSALSETSLGSASDYLAGQPELHAGVARRTSISIPTSTNRFWSPASLPVRPGYCSEPAGCLDTHLDTDDDVDETDLAVFLRCLSGLELRQTDLCRLIRFPGLLSNN